MKQILDKRRKTLLIECDCLNMDHMLKFEYYDESDKPEDKFPPDDMFSVSTALSVNSSFIRRLVLAFKYLFRMYPYNYYMFGDTILLPSDVRELTQFLQKYNDYIEKNNLFR